MLSIISAIVSIFVGLKNLFTGKGKDNAEDAASKAVAQSNEAGKLSADVTRQTETTNEQSVQDADKQKAIDLDSVHNAYSMRDRQNAVARIVGSPDEDTHTNG